MSTFGFNFKPWCKANVLADGASIKGYLGEVINEFKLKEKFILVIAYFLLIMIRLQKWQVVVEDSNKNSRLGLLTLWSVVQVTIIMIRVMRLLSQIKKHLKGNSFTHSIGLKT